MEIKRLSHSLRLSSPINSEQEDVFAAASELVDAPRMWWCEDTGAAWELRPFLCGGPYHKSCGRVRLVKEDNGELMDVAKTLRAVRAFEGVDLRDEFEPIMWLLDAAKWALEVQGAGCAQWTEGVCGGRLVDGLCGTHQPTEPIPLPDPNEWMKEMQ